MDGAIRWSAWQRIVVAALAVLAMAALPGRVWAQDVPFVGVVTAEKAPLLSGPGSAYETGLARPGTLVRVEKVEHGWCKIVPPEGCYSFVSKAWVDAEGDGKAGVTNRDRVAVKAANAGDRGNSYRTQTSLPKGQKVQILGEYGGSYMIVPPDGAFVYIAAGSVRKATREEAAAEAPTQAPIAIEAQPLMVEVKPADPKAAAPAATPRTEPQTPAAPKPEPAPVAEAPRPAEPEGAKVETPVETTAPAPAEVAAATPPVETTPAPAPEPEPATLAVAKTEPTPPAAQTPEPAAAPKPETVTEAAAAAPAPETELPEKTPTETPEVITPEVIAPEVVLAPEPAAPLPLYSYSEAEMEIQYVANQPSGTPVDERLLESYEALATDPSLNASQRHRASSRLTYLRSRAAVADALAKIKAVREAPAHRELPHNTSTTSPSSEPMVHPDAVGWLTASSVYNGQRLPRLYRLVDPKNQRTLAYVKPGPGIEERQLLGKLLAVRGVTSQDQTLNIPVIEIRDLRVMQTTNQ